MNAFLYSLLCLGVLLMTASAESPSPPPAAASTVSLPLKRLVLYSSGVGYFQRDGQVEGRGQVALRFKVDNINDLLKSMIVQDFDGGQVHTVTYDSRDPLTKTLKSFAVDLTENPTLGQLLGQIRGEQVEVATPNPVRGVLLGVETRREQAGDNHFLEVEYINLFTDSGLRSIALPQIQHVQLLDPQINAELRQALTTLASSHERDKKTVQLAFDGQGQRRVRVAYIIATPVWKTSYRLVLTEQDKPFLQGWALVENTTDEDWQDIQLSLMSGRPISFVMDMYEPLYVPRPVVVPEVYASLRPQVYEQAIESAKEGAAGRAEHLQEERSLRSRRGPQAQEFALPLAQMAPAAPPPAPETPADLALHQGVATAASAAAVGELFEYSIAAPVSLARQKSAMLPIVNAAIEGAKVSIYNERVHAKYPLHGFRLHNATDLHLMQGPITVFDGGRYAGDARLDDVSPGQERLISYALDVQTEVEPVRATEQQELVSVSLRKGVLIATRKALATTTYNLRNRDQKPRTVLVEHPFRADWQLVAPQTAAERTREVYRFVVSLAANQGSTLPVQEEKPLRQVVALTDPGLDLGLYLRANQVSPRVKEALQRVVTLRDRLEQTRQQRQRLEQRIEEITREQERLRQNMQQLAQNSELYGRYVRKLDQQESDLEALQRDIETLKTTEQTQQRELDLYVQGLDISS